MTKANSCTDRNQCDGCRRGLPIRYSRVAPSDRTPLHYDPDAGYVVMACTKDRYMRPTRSPYDLNGLEEFPGD